MKLAISAAMIFGSTEVFLASPTGAQPAVSHPAPRISLTSSPAPDVKRDPPRGVSHVFETRPAPGGRKLPLKIVLTPARRPHPEQAPVFYVPGGPGETATEAAADL